MRGDAVRDAQTIDVVAGHRTARQMDVGLLRISHAIFPAAHRIPLHRHDRACMSVIIEGGFRQRFPGKVFECRSGSVLTKPPSERHEDRWYDTRAEHVILEPDPERHEELGPCRDLAESVRHFGRDPVAEGIARRIAHELSDPDPLTPLAIESLGLQLLVRVGRLGAGEAAAPGLPLWLERVRELIHDRYDEGLKCEELAREAGVHPSHLSRMFVERFGVGVAEYQRRVRLAAARRDLAESDLSLSTVALRNGFSDQSHLTRVLRRETGLTPARYRAAARR